MVNPGLTFPLVSVARGALARLSRDYLSTSFSKSELVGINRRLIKHRYISDVSLQKQILSDFLDRRLWTGDHEKHQIHEKGGRRRMRQHSEVAPAFSPRLAAAAR